MTSKLPFDDAIYSRPIYLESATDYRDLFGGLDYDEFSILAWLADTAEEDADILALFYYKEQFGYVRFGWAECPCCDELTSILSEAERLGTRDNLRAIKLNRRLRTLRNTLIEGITWGTASEIKFMIRDDSGAEEDILAEFLEIVQPHLGYTPMDPTVMTNKYLELAKSLG